MYAKQPDIAALISSRICHDLASPLGAISNGLELLELSGIPHSPEFALLKDSIDSANARVQFFRIAYGSVATEAMLAPGAIQKILAAYFADKKVRAQWIHLQPTPRTEVKLLFLLIQCLETALPYGGDIRLSTERGIWQLAATGRVNLSRPAWQVFYGERLGEELQPAQVQFELARMLAFEIGKKIGVSGDEDAATITVS